MQPFNEGDLDRQWRDRLRGRIEDAFKLMAKPAGLRRAHIRVKQARAMLELGRESAHPHKIERLDRKLHDIAKPMSTARDAEELLATAQSNHVPAKLVARLQDEGVHAAKRVEKKRASLRKKLEKLVTSSLPRLSDKNLRASVAKTERDAHATMRLAERHPHRKAFHELRKRCKDLRCQYELLSVVFTGCARKAKAARDVGDCLGKAHDLRALVSRLSHGRDSELRSVLERKISELEAVALHQSKSLLQQSSARKGLVRRR